MMDDFYGMKDAFTPLIFQIECAGVWHLASGWISTKPGRLVANEFLTAPPSELSSIRLCDTTTPPRSSTYCVDLLPMRCF
jgi:hypothetical protein